MGSDNMLMWIVSLVISGSCVEALSLGQVNVPPFGPGGQSVELGCEYDTQGDQVYSVKWYKGGLEIFRFIPSNTPPMAVFTRPGVSIGTEQSNATLLHLTNLTVASTGRYRCEVSTEAPMFSTESKYGDLLVIVLPSHPPKISGAGNKSLSYLAPGDHVQLTCHSDQSRPAADLTWSINGNKVDEANVETLPIMSHNETLLFSSQSQLNISLTKEHFTDDGKIEISCVASIGSLQTSVNTGSASDSEDIL